ncbi:MAG: signal peptide prediction [Rubrivivax sp.]
MHRRGLAQRAWALPCSALGLCAAAAFALIAGPLTWRRVRGVLEIAPSDPARAERWPGVFDAITFGHVVLGRSPSLLAGLRAHEHAHVAQYARWGPLMLILYPLESLWQAARGHRPYLDNRFEVQARAAAAAQAPDATLDAVPIVRVDGLHDRPDRPPVHAGFL